MNQHQNQQQNQHQNQLNSKSKLNLQQKFMNEIITNEYFEISFGTLFKKRCY